MKNIAFYVAVAAAAFVGISYLVRNDPQKAARLAEEELKDLRDHFKSLDAV